MTTEAVTAVEQPVPEKREEEGQEEKVEVEQITKVEEQSPGGDSGTDSDSEGSGPEGDLDDAQAQALHNQVSV